MGIVPLLTAVVETTTFAIYTFEMKWEIVPFIGTGSTVLLTNEETAEGASGFC